MNRTLYIIISALLFPLYLCACEPVLTPHHVNVLTGQLELAEQEICLPGPLPLVIERSWGRKVENAGEVFGWQITARPNGTCAGGLKTELSCTYQGQFDKFTILGLTGKAKFGEVYLQDQRLSSHLGHVVQYAIEQGLLSKASYEDGSSVSYAYCQHPLTRQPLLAVIERENGQRLQNEYYVLGYNQLQDRVIEIQDIRDKRIGRIKTQKAAIGSPETLEIVAEFEYFDDHTVVWDNAGAKTVYRYSAQGDRVVAIEEYLADEGVNSLYRVKEYLWGYDSAEPQLIAEMVKTAEGITLACKTFAYGQNGQLIQETLWGNLTGLSAPAISLNCDGWPDELATEHYSLYRSYDQANRLLEKWEDNGRRESYLYDPATGLLASRKNSFEDAVLYSASYFYNEEGILTEVIEEEEASRQRKVMSLSDQPETYGMPVIQEEFSGEGEEMPLRTLLKVYSNRAQLVQQRIFNAQGECIEESNADFDSLGRVLQTGNSFGQEAAFTYDLQGNCIFDYEALSGMQHAYSYDLMNRKTYQQEIDAKGHYTCNTYTYGSGNKPIASVNSDGQTIRYVYDSLGRLIAAIYPACMDEEGNAVQPTVSQLYDLQDNLTDVIDPKGFITKIRYTARAQPSEIQYADGSTEAFVYNLDGSMHYSISKAGVKTVYQYDQKGRVVGEDEIGGFSLPCALNMCCQIETPHFQEHLWVAHELLIVNKTAAVLDNGTFVETTIDALGRPIETIHFGKNKGILAKQEYRYDLAGNKAWQKEGAYHAGELLEETVTRWYYGPCNRLEKKIEHAGQAREKVTAYRYNAAGELVEIVKPDGVSIYWEYSNGNIESMFASDGSFAYQYNYDQYGNITHMEDLAHSYTGVRIFNADAKLAEELLGNGLQIAKEYDSLGRPVQLHLPDGSNIVYSYNDQGLAKVVKNGSHGKADYAFEITARDDQGRPTSMQMIGQLGELCCSWDETGHCTAIESPYWSESIEIANGKLQKQTIRTLGGEEISEYQYDGLEQLLAESGRLAASYAFDSLCRRLEDKQDGSGIARPCCQYDIVGNLIKKEHQNKTTIFRYDALNRLIEAFQEQAFKVEYAYDALHRCMSRTVFCWKETIGKWQQQDRLLFVYDENNEIAAFDDQGNIRQLRVLAEGMGAEIGAAVAIETPSGVYAPIHDHRGNVSCLVSVDSGEVAENYSYSAFGAEMITGANGEVLQASKTGNPWRFQSKRSEELLAQSNFGRRHYDPEIGSWLSPDPLGSCDGPNPHAFLQNNPMLQIDFYGLFSVQTAWQNVREASFKWYEKIQGFCNAATTSVYSKFAQAGEFLLGKNLFLISGFYVTPPEYGIHGEGEFYPKMRLTFINGLFNLRHHFDRLLELISSSFKGNNVHYIYKGIEGWGRDMMTAFCIRYLGLVSKNARQLATLWKGLIEEMGGVGQGGVIMHFAHSIGGMETFRAKQLVSPEEQKMIRVVSFGSPGMLPTGGFQDVHNVVSYRDGVSMILDPIGFFRGVMGFDEHTVMIGTYKGVPLIDHGFGTYWDYWMTTGINSTNQMKLAVK